MVLTCPVQFAVWRVAQLLRQHTSALHRLEGLCLLFDCRPLLSGISVWCSFVHVGVHAADSALLGFDCMPTDVGEDRRTIFATRWHSLLAVAGILGIQITIFGRTTAAPSTSAVEERMLPRLPSGAAW
jgi:hypothetical protein